MSRPKMHLDIKRTVVEYVTKLFTIFIPLFKNFLNMDYSPPPLFIIISSTELLLYCIAVRPDSCDSFLLCSVLSITGVKAFSPNSY